MLEGSATLRLGEKTYLIKAGDFVSFSAGQKAGHALINDSAAPSRFLMIGERRADDVCVNPDSNRCSTA